MTTAPASYPLDPVLDTTPSDVVTPNPALGHS